MDRFQALEEDIAELKAWAHSHDEAHTADTRLLASIMDSVSNHTTNHHGKASTIKQNSVVAAALTLLYAVAEILRQFVF